MKPVRFILHGIVLALLLLVAHATDASAQQPQCFNVLDDSIACVETRSGFGVRVWLDLQNKMETNVGSVDFDVLSPANVTASPTTRTLDAPVAYNGTIDSLVFTLSGAGVVEGATVAVLVTVRASASTANFFCTDTVFITMPECAPSCTDLINDSVVCGINDAGGLEYHYFFDLVNDGLLQWPGSTVGYAVIGRQDISVTPSNVETGDPFEGGDTLADRLIRFTGNVSAGDSVRLETRICSVGVVCCRDTTTVYFPDCEPEGCLSATRLSLRCGTAPNTYSMPFAFTNESNDTLTFLTLSTPNGSIPSGGPMSVGLLAPGATYSNTVLVNVPSSFVGDSIEITTITANDEGATCENAFMVALPKCSWGCFGLTDVDIVCVPSSTGIPVYRVTATLHNQSGQAIRNVRGTSLTPNVVLPPTWLDLGAMVADGDSILFDSLFVGGAGATEGRDIAIVLELAGATPNDPVCLDTIVLTLPICTPPLDGCLAIASQKTTCVGEPGGPQQVTWSMTVLNLGNQTLDSLRITSLVSDGGAIVATQTFFEFAPGIEPGDSATINTTLSGVGAIDGANVSTVLQGLYGDQMCRLPMTMAIDCDIDTDRCFDVVDTSATPRVGSQTRIDLTLEVRNMSGQPVDRFLLSAPGAPFTIVNPTISIGTPLAPTETMSLNFALDNVPAVQFGQNATFYLVLATGSVSNPVCVDSITIRMPQQSSGVDDESGISGLTLAAYPNPAGTDATLKIALDHRVEGAILRIVDAKGREHLRPLDDATLTPGTTLLPIDASALPSGVYHAMLEVDGRVVSTSITVLR